MAENLHIQLGTSREEVYNDLWSMGERHGLDYHHMLLGLHGDCDEEDVMKAVSIRSSLINRLDKYRPVEESLTTWFKYVSNLLTQSCYQYAAYVSDKMMKEWNE